MDGFRQWRRLRTKLQGFIGFWGGEGRNHQSKSVVSHPGGGQEDDGTAPSCTQLVRMGGQSADRRWEEWSIICYPASPCFTHVPTETPRPQEGLCKYFFLECSVSSSGGGVASLRFRLNKSASCSARQGRERLALTPTKRREGHLLVDLSVGGRRTSQVAWALQQKPEA